LWINPDEVINRYLDYAILASTESSASIGDLQFDITIDSTFVGGLRLWLPVGFTLLNVDGSETEDPTYNIWTDATNDYSYITAGTRNDYDSVCPGCIRITIGFPGVQPDDDPDWYAGTTWDPGTYHVRIFHVKAPMEAGVYQFKFAMGEYSPEIFDPSDWPIMIVKSELNPAYITGSIALCAEEHAPEPRESCTLLDTARYGKVWVEGTTPEGRSVSARYYFSPADVPSEGFPDSLMYNFIIFGVAPGTYDVKAKAGGFPESTGERLTVTIGQSLHIKPFYLVYGPTLDVTVWSKLA